MNSIYYYRGLLWKELRENARLFGLAFVLISWQNLFYPVFNWLLMGGETFDKWSSTLLAIMNPNALDTSFMVQIGIMISIAIGVLILSHERSGSLEYLVSTPVNRKEIIISKFMSGSLALACIMFINAAVVVLVLTLRPVALVSKAMVIGWSFSIAIAWICIFTLSLLASTLCRNYAVAGLATLFMVTLPGMITQFACQIATHYFDASEKAALRIYNSMKHVDLWALLAMKNPREADSVDASGSFFIGTTSHGIWDETQNYFTMNNEVLFHLVELTALTIVFLALAVWLFSRSPLERKEDWLMFGHFKHVAIIFVTFLIALQQSLDRAGSFLEFIGFFVLLFTLIYLIFILLSRFFGLFRIHEWMGR